MRLLLAFAVLFFALPAYAHHTAEHMGPFQEITVEVNGMVCDFCARGLEKVFYKQDGVEGVIVNLDEHIVKLEVAPGMELTDDKINGLITESGFNVVKITREKE